MTATISCRLCQRGLAHTISEHELRLAVTDRLALQMSLSSRLRRAALRRLRWPRGS